MAWWEWLLDAAGVLLLLLVAYGLALVARRRVLTRNGGTFELSHRLRTDREGRGWVLGIGRYSGERLEWFRVFTLALRPRVVWERDALSYDGRREAMGTEQVSLYPDHLVICCRTRDGDLELAMSAGSLTGFQAWLEARPPGTDWDH